ncbi:sulfatase-like hydrolase/transferase [Paenibacillus filicis]|uniref:Sulfatase-like hydrolase/transferase n=1 Tax=Paenibacillus gyeongsangnamensis TaxID=3388067 RepID=A0ABT4QA50_9BACL|nr:sulfatase-like hydrolase/transferase [Paenibacillus filicis]MCZ8513718.1 sulfatase-like hydrolase/transferase [Paenibacillus filicis]
MSVPNIVLITTDQMRADLMGCAGNPIIQTPHLDFLAKRGGRFTQAISTQPVCIPARATIMTGLEGHSLGITTYKEGFEIPVEDTLPRLLNQAGYQTKAVGKMHVYPERCHYGFESMLICEEGRIIGQANNENKGLDDYEQWLAEQGYPGQAFGHGLANNEYAVTPWHLPDRLHPTEWIGLETCKAIKNRDWTRPLFLWSSFTAPHPPLAPLLNDLYLYDRDSMPKPVKGDWVGNHPLFHQYNLAQWFGDQTTEKQTDLAYRAFYALITQVDRQINRIIGTLREEGMLDNTWFIFASDHGDCMGDHQLWSKSNFLRGACNIPLIITPPPRGNLDRAVAENWVPGITSHSVVGLQDIMPTCLEIAGVAAPNGLDGKSLLPLLKEPSAKVRDAILGEFGPIGKRSFMLSDGCWKYIWYEEDDAQLLFHVADDPDEISDLSTKLPAKAQVWRKKLADKLQGRINDRAIDGDILRPVSPDRMLSELERARMVTDHNARGLH